MSDNDKKREIRRKALSLFKEKGYDNVTVNEIASAASISKNTFYYYYKSKEELIRDVFKPSSYSGEKLAVELMKSDDPYEQIMTLCRLTAAHFQLLGKEVVRKAMILNLGDNIIMSDRPKEKDHHPSWQHEMIHAIYQRAIEQKKIRTDLQIKELVRLQMCLLIGVLQSWATMPCDFDLVKTYLKMAQQVLNVPEQESGDKHD
ncbi:TetR/AcrR family transcriptional regulator [Lactimicrobium sp.]|jgi:AcrR family transcriptional regulator|uniref:TetR/AcrR family transcriptional regulator n=1 Tax=Lactimicrobium sp. TaxID=2563780 RepID=UPI002F35E4E2